MAPRNIGPGSELNAGMCHVRRNASAATLSLEAGAEKFADLTAAYLCRITSIENRTIDNSVVHRGWLHKLRDDRKLITHAMGQPPCACDCSLERRAVPRLTSPTFEQTGRPRWTGRHS